MSHPADRPGIPAEGEPITSFRPLRAGDVEPGRVQPAGGPPFLEEEPALWPDVSEAARPAPGEPRQALGIPPSR